MTFEQFFRNNLQSNYIFIILIQNI